MKISDILKFIFVLLILAGVVWVIFASPWWLALPLGVGLIIYSFFPHAHARWSMISGRDKDGSRYISHSHPEVAIGACGLMILSRLLFQLTRAHLHF